MKLRFLKHRWQRVTTRILIVLIGLILVLGMSINLYMSPILANKLRSTVLNSSDSLYRINFTKAELHVLQGKIVIFNIDLEPDTNVYHQRHKLHTAPNNLYHLHIKKLVLRHIHPFRLYFSRKLDIGELIISAPELHITYQLNHTKDTTEKDKRNLYQRIANTLHAIHVGHIGLNDVQFKYEDYSGNKVVISELKELNVSANDLLIDSTSMNDKSRFLYCKDVITEINNFSGKTMNGLYYYKMKLLTFSTHTSQLNAQDIDVTPISPAQFFDKSKHARFNLHVDSLQLNNFDYINYHKFRRFVASSMVLTKGCLDIFGRPHLQPQARQEPGGDRSATFPNAGIYKLNTDLKIDTVLLDRVNISYTELNGKSRKTGTAYFNNTSGSILNLTTNAEALKKNKYCDVTLRSWFMNKSKLTTSFKFDMVDKDLAYSYKGHLDPMNLPVINKTVMPLAMVKINSGKLKSFDFDIHADKYTSRGRVTLLYNDLKITLLKPDTAQKKLKRMMIESLFANAMVIKHNNPDNEGETPRSYFYIYRREPDFPFFKTVWKTLLNGIRLCAGYGEEREQQIKSQMADHAVKKAERKQRKEERKQKRAERKAEKEIKKRLKEEIGN